MSEVKTTGNAVYNINYHIVWIPKYRKGILENLSGECRAIFDGIAKRYGFEILALEVMPDHIHFFVSAPPRYSPAEVAKAFKGASARQLFASSQNSVASSGADTSGPRATMLVPPET